MEVLGKFGFHSSSLGVNDPAGGKFYKADSKKRLLPKGVILPLLGRRSLEFRLLVMLQEGSFEDN